MKINQIINNLILDIFPLMPSSGAWPFTIISVDRSKFLDLEVHQILKAPTQLLVLQRTDFNHQDLLDYIYQSKEYRTIALEKQADFVEQYIKPLKDETAFTAWMNKISSLAIGLIRQTAISKALTLNVIEIDLDQLDSHLELNVQNLKAYQLFDVYQLDPSFLKTA